MEHLFYNQFSWFDVIVFYLAGYCFAKENYLYAFLALFFGAIISGIASRLLGVS